MISSAITDIKASYIITRIICYTCNCDSMIIAPTTLAIPKFVSVHFCNNCIIVLDILCKLCKVYKSIVC